MWSTNIFIQPKFIYNGQKWKTALRSEEMKFEIPLGNVFWTKEDKDDPAAIKFKFPFIYIF